jgi:hypothetical protein
MNDEELIKEGVEKALGLYDLLQTPYTDFEKYQVPFPLDKDEKRYQPEKNWREYVK